MPIAISIFLCVNFRRLENPDFEQRYGALYSGLAVKKRSALAYPVIFVTRRFAFALLVCFWRTFLWLQIAFQFFSLIGFAAYLLAYRPLVSKKQSGLELMNELT